MDTVWRPVVRIVFLVGICLVYLIFSLQFDHSSLFKASPDAYYSFLLDAFVHGRVNVVSEQTFDLSLYQGKWYMNWGPAPVLYILPYYLVNGVEASSRFYTLMAGMQNIVLFYLVLLEFKKYFRLKLFLFFELFLVLSFSFCSANFYLSFTPNLWMTATEQVIALFYLLFCYLFYFKFLNSRKYIIFLVLSVVFFNLAWLSRYAMIFHFLIFGYLFFIGDFRMKEKLKIAFLITGITFLFGCSLLYYNYLKFGNPLETGLRYQNSASEYRGVYKDKNFFSVSWIPQNIYYYFLNFPSISYPFSMPFVNIDIRGNSVFVFYPSVLLLFFLGRKKYFVDRRMKWFIIVSGTVILCTLVFLMCYFATGWIQFGNRFFLDIIPLIYLLVAFVLKDIPLLVTGMLLVYELTVNFLGVLNFFTR